MISRKRRRKGERQDPMNGAADDGMNGAQRRRAADQGGQGTTTALVPEGALQQPRLQTGHPLLRQLLDVLQSS